MNFEPINDGRPEFWEGAQNVAIRMWTYILTGLAQVNNYKYVAAAIFGIYYTLKLVNPIWIGVMFIVSMPLLAVLGRWWLYKGAKTSEYVTTNKGSVIGYRGFNMGVRQIELLEQILNELKRKN